MKILVTGGAGFIGSHLVEHFQGEANIRVLDNLSNGNINNLNHMNYEFFNASITDREAVRTAIHGVDYVFHLAAMTNVPESMQKMMEFVEINTAGTLVVLEEAVRAGVKKLCFSSSSANYGDGPEVAKTELMPSDPQSPYAMTKLDGEYYCNLFSREGMLNTVCLRYFNVFGPKQSLYGDYSAAIPTFINNALQHKPITIFGDGEQTRDFVYVKDVVAANVFLAGIPADSGFYNVGSGRGKTINELVNKVIGLTQSSSKIEYAPLRPGDVKHSLASIKKLMSTGFSSSFSFNDGLGKTIQYFQNK